MPALEIPDPSTEDYQRTGIFCNGFTENQNVRRFLYSYRVWSVYEGKSVGTKASR